ncbi:ABC transporter permease [Winogradskyella algicola]|uniref:ABC transporter permease n=1 Tax=Winogradskyella algicola TaxID=2575815 RepID=UPI001108348D|nr:ABC transporter permease subunit [Winogradskyella algicola]
MLRLLNIELFKLWNNKSSRVLIILSFVLPFTIAFITSIKIDLGFIRLDPSEYGIFNFPFIWHWNTYFASIFKMFFALVAISMISNEYNYRTLKQNLIDGLSKKEMILSKFYVILAYALVSTVGVFIMSIIIGSIYSTYTEASIVFTDLEYLLAYFLKLVGFFSFCLFITLLVKRSVFSIGIIIILSAIEWISYAYMRWEVYENQAQEIGYNFAEGISQFFPLMSLYNLIEQPMVRYATRINPEDIGLIHDYTVQWQEILIVIVWTALFIFLSYRLLKKRDL